jgi:uncharacterized protein YndB with AHSA1/START domain
MSTRSTTHATFVLERTYDAGPARVFGAWASLEAKRRWFGPGDEHELDFRVGGSEHLVVNAAAGPRYTFDSRYQDIVPDERIVYSYEMYKDEDRISVSVTTVEMAPVEGGTLLTMTEQGVFLDDLDDPAAREHGTRELLEALGKAIADEAREVA